MSHTITNTDDGSVEFVLLTEQLLPGALKVLRDSFLVDESVSSVLSIINNKKSVKETEDLICEVVRDGASVVAVEVSTGKVVGIAINKIQVKGAPDEPGLLEKILQSKTVTQEYENLLNFFINIESTANAFKYFDVDCLLDLMFLATLKGYRRIGVGRKLVEASVIVAKEYGHTIMPRGMINHPKPKAVIAIFTSKKSQSIGKSLKWYVLSTVRYDTLYYDGKPFSSILGPNEPVTVFTGTKL